MQESCESRVVQTIVLSSQTEKLGWAAAFSKSLGQKPSLFFFFENFRARLALPLSRRSFRGFLIKPKNESAQTAPKMKS